MLAAPAAHGALAIREAETTVVKPEEGGGVKLEDGTAPSPKRPRIDGPLARAEERPVSAPPAEVAGIPEAAKTESQSPPGEAAPAPPNLCHAIAPLGVQSRRRSTQPH